MLPISKQHMQLGLFQGCDIPFTSSLDLWWRQQGRMLCDHFICLLLSHLAFLVE
ncbi:unnamed protein product, partial [Vitis vinifera]